MWTHTPVNARATTHTSLMRALLRSSAGQDLVEYALLVAFVAFAGLAAAPLIQNALGAAYTLYNTGSQDLWQPPNPEP